MESSQKYTVQLDAKGHILIPAAVRKAKGLKPDSFFILVVGEGDEIRLVPAEVMPRRAVRKYTPEQIAEGLALLAVTEEGRAEAILGIQRLGLNPADYLPGE